MMWINRFSDVEKTQDLATMDKAKKNKKLNGILERYPHFHKKKEKRSKKERKTTTTTTPYFYH